MKYLICSDFFIEDFVGGAALNDEELYKILTNNGEEVELVKTNKISKDFLEENKDSLFIISNFFGIHPTVLPEFKNLKYVLYAHDYKFVQHTNPAVYEDFIIPKEELINVEFHQNAAAIICQSSFQEDIYRKNIENIKTINFSGNLWSDEVLSLLESLIETDKEEKVSVVKSPYPQKGVPEAIRTCIENQFNYDLVSDENYEKFLKKLSKNRGLAFIPLTPETLSRIVVECKMMNIKVFTTNLVGASYEPWFDKQGKELIEVMRAKKQEIYDIIKSIK